MREVRLEHGVEAQASLDLVAKLHRLADDEHRPRPPAGEAPHQARRRRPGGPVVDPDEALVLGVLIARDESDGVQPALAQPPDRVARLRRLGSHDRHAVDVVRIQGRERRGDGMGIALRQVVDAELDHLGGEHEVGLRDACPERANEEVVRPREQEPEAERSSSGQDGGGRIPDEADLLDGLIDALDRARPNAAAPVQHPIDRGEADTGGLGEIAGGGGHLMVLRP